MTIVYRPSGQLTWLLNKFDRIVDWSVVGMISVEERSLATISELKRLGKLGTSSFIKAEPSKVRPNRFLKSTQKKLNQRQKEAKHIAGTGMVCNTVDLLCKEEVLIQACRDSLSRCGPNLILDISSMPKRFFFPLVGLALRSGKFENIFVSYSVPKTYGDILSEDPMPWSPFPTFGAIDLPRDLKLIIGVGYQSLRLHEIVSEFHVDPNHIELLLPFPSTQPGFTKNWEFIRQLKVQLGQLHDRSIKRVPITNTSIAFDRIVGITNKGATAAVLAPFGPKPVSLAMCLYGIYCQDKNIPVAIGYTQPQVYSDEYAIGTAIGSDGNPNIHAFCIQLNSKNIYNF